MGMVKWDRFQFRATDWTGASRLEDEMWKPILKWKISGEIGRNAIQGKPGICRTHAELKHEAGQYVGHEWQVESVYRGNRGGNCRVLLTIASL